MPLSSSSSNGHEAAKYFHMFALNLKGSNNRSRNISAEVVNRGEKKPSG